MSGSDIAGKLLIPTQVADDLIDVDRVVEERLPWPASVLLIALLSAGLWFGIAAVLRSLFG